MRKIDSHFVLLIWMMGFCLASEASAQTSEWHISLGRGELKMRFKMASFKIRERVAEHETVSLNPKPFTSAHSGTDKPVLHRKPLPDGDSLLIAASGADFIELPLFHRLHYKGGPIYGGGEQHSHLRLDGHQFHLYTEEQGIGRGDPPVSWLLSIAGHAGTDWTSYAPVPFFLVKTEKAWAGVIVHSHAYMNCDFRAKAQTIRVWTDTLSLSRATFETPLAVIRWATGKMGRMPRLPNWAFDTWLGIQGGQDRVEAIIKEAQAAGNPIGAIWIQDWVGKRQTRFGSQLWWRWRPDSTSYPDFRNWADSLRREGIRTLGYINTFLATGTKAAEFAKRKGYLVLNQAEEVYELKTPGFPAYLVDLSNPAAYDWLKRIIQERLIGNGLRGWMADYAEWLPPDANLHNGADPKKWHNTYAVRWAQCNREAINQAEMSEKIVFFTRAGHLGSSTYSTLFWQGDQLVGWGEHDGLASSVTGQLSSGISGIGFNHSDIGGYTTINAPLLKVHRSRELLWRWIECNMFQPVFRTHEGLIPEKNAQVYTDVPTVEFFATAARVRKRMRPYFRQVATEVSSNGWPFNRAMVLHYPADSICQSLKTQFMMGRDLLVAPVLHPEATKVRVYLPTNEWIEARSGKRLSQGWHKVEAPLGQPAVFIRKDSPSFESINAALRPLYDG